MCCVLFVFELLVARGPACTLFSHGPFVICRPAPAAVCTVFSETRRRQETGVVCVCCRGSRSEPVMAPAGGAHRRLFFSCFFVFYDQAEFVFFFFFSSSSCFVRVDRRAPFACSCSTPHGHESHCNCIAEQICAAATGSEPQRQCAGPNLHLICGCRSRPDHLRWIWPRQRSC